jgi:hypothetical protein
MVNMEMRVDDDPNVRGSQAAEFQSFNNFVRLVRHSGVHNDVMSPLGEQYGGRATPTPLQEDIDFPSTVLHATPSAKLATPF